MSAPIILKFDGDVRAMKEAMIIAGGKLRMGARRQTVMALLSVVSFICMAAGGAAFGAFLAILVASEIELMVPAIIGGMLGAVLALRWYDRLIGIMAGAVLEAPFNKGPQELRFDTRGVTLTNGQAEWFTAWSGVHGIELGKDSLAALISGIALYAPLRALPDDSDAMLMQISAWREGAA